jgi:transglutaminase-like putative cysteine protease
MKAYLEFTSVIDWNNLTVKQLAMSLSTDSTLETAKNCFEWVRDNIKHSGEFQLNPVTYKASDVLTHKTGFCFAKSHLLAALLRANHIPTGFCYQCLSMDDAGDNYCLHGLNAIYLEEYGCWYRVDPRGNNKHVNAQFTPPVEQLAFPINLPQEVDYLEVCAEPLPKIVSLLSNCKSYQEVIEKLPETATIQPQSPIKSARIPQ